MNVTFEVTVIDQWPKLKLLVKRGGTIREESPIMYDLAATQWVPAVTDSLRNAVNEVIQKRKGGS
jgi:hypothetical protein